MSAFGPFNLEELNADTIEALQTNEVLRRHYFRLRSQRQRIDRQPNSSRKDSDMNRWNSAAKQAREQFAARIASKVTLHYDAELPITAYRDKIIDLLIHRQVLVLCGETGSGKSTQLPKFCLEAGLGKFGWIGHTQPRRIAARSISHRLAEELETKGSDVVGYKVRFNDGTEAMLRRFGTGPHIANLGHGVYPDTDPDNVRVFVETVKGWRA